MSDTQDNAPASAQGVDKMAAEGCPVAHDSVTATGSESENPAIDSPTPKTGGRPHTNRDWWPNQLDLSVLHAHSSKGNPLGEDFSYAREFAKLDVDALGACRFLGHSLPSVSLAVSLAHSGQKPQ